MKGGVAYNILLKTEGAFIIIISAKVNETLTERHAVAYLAGAITRLCKLLSTKRDDEEAQVIIENLIDKKTNVIFKLSRSELRRICASPFTLLRSLLDVGYGYSCCANGGRACRFGRFAWRTRCRRTIPLLARCQHRGFPF